MSNKASSLIQEWIREQIYFPRRGLDQARSHSLKVIFHFRGIVDRSETGFGFQVPAVFYVLVFFGFCFACVCVCVCVCICFVVVFVIVL